MYEICTRIEYFCRLTLSTISPKYTKHIAEQTLIPAPESITPKPINHKLKPTDINTDPKAAIPKDTDIVNFLPILSETKQANIKPIKEPKYGKLLIMSSKYSFSQIKGP